MADCYWHGYSGGSGPCPDCENERRNNVEQGSTPGTNLDGGWTEQANISSIGRAAAAKQAKEAQDKEPDDQGN